MIKSAKIQRGRRRKSAQLELPPLLSWEIFLIYRQWLLNLSPSPPNLLFLGINLFFLIHDWFSLIKGYSSENYGIWKLGNLWINTFCVFLVFIRLSITNLPYTERWLIYRKSVMCNCINWVKRLCAQVHASYQVI